MLFSKPHKDVLQTQGHLLKPNLERSSAWYQIKDCKDLLEEPSEASLRVAAVPGNAGTREESGLSTQLEHNMQFYHSLSANSILCETAAI